MVSKRLTVTLSAWELYDLPPLGKAGMQHPLILALLSKKGLDITKPFTWVKSPYDESMTVQGEALQPSPVCEPLSAHC